MGRRKLAESEKKVYHPVVTFRMPKELDMQFTAVRYEAGDIDRSTALVRILEYLLQPQSIETTKSIIQDR